MRRPATAPSSITRSLLALFLAASSPLAALEVADQAPSLAGVTWIKGAAPAAGSVLVVEFWATWCGPCRTSIPHLTALQRKYAGQLQVVGLSSENSETVKPFVEQQGEQMAYRVGLLDEEAAQSFMKDIDGIPHAFLVDAGGTVLWHGHPTAIDGTLAQVMAGTYDVATAKLLSEAHKELDAAAHNSPPDIDAMLEVIARIRRTAPFDEKAVELAISVGQFRKDAAQIRSVMASIDVDGCPPELANSVTWSRATDDELSFRHLDVALRLIRRAVAKDPGNAAIIDTQARVLHEIGWFDAAMAWEEKAVALDAREAAYARTLAYYRQLQALRSASAAPNGPGP